MSTALPDQLKWEYSAFPVQISQKQRLSPGFMRITVTGDKLRFFGQWGLDQRIKLIIPSPAGNIPDFGILDEPTPHRQRGFLVLSLFQRTNDRSCAPTPHLRSDPNYAK